MTDKKLECFVISPIGSAGSTIRREADWVLKKLIHPALADTYKITRADEFTKGEIITNKVIISIQKADVIVAVMAGHNPNVFYELAVAHAYSKPVVPLIRDGESIPFDVGFVGTIFYSHDDVAVWDSAIDQVKAAADASRMSGYEASNPITMALGAAKASASPDTSERMVAKLTSELATLRREMTELRSVVGVEHYKNAFFMPSHQLGTPHSARSMADLGTGQFYANLEVTKLAEMDRLYEASLRTVEKRTGRSLTFEEKDAHRRQYFGLSDDSKDDDR